MEELIKKAGILIEALPYIQKFAGNTVVIKYGGNAMINEELKNSVIEDIILLKYIGLKPIVVHGGGPDISKALADNNIESKFVNGLRVTDSDTIRIAQEVLVGKTNKELVSLFNLKGGKAIGFCGIDGSCLKCEKEKTMVDGKETDIGFVGHIVEVNNHIIDYICKDQYIPVIAPIGVDENGQSYNINADTVASAVARSMQADKLILLTDAEGVKCKDGSVVYEMDEIQVKEMISDGSINGGMIPKVLGCVEAIQSGVKGVHIIDGRVPHCLLLEIFTKTGIGTLIKGSNY